MIKSYLCDCCYRCSHADIDHNHYDTTIYADDGGNTPYLQMNDWTIFCTKADVCEDYRKEMKKI